MKALLAIALLAAAAPARADDGDTMGSFPTIEFGLVGGVGLTPVAYTLDHGFGRVDTSESVTGGFVGPEIHVHAAFDAMLVHGEVAHNSLQGDVASIVRGQIVLGKTLGMRTSHNVIKSIHDSMPDSQGRFTRTTEFYAHKRVPMYVGLSAELSVWNLASTSYTSAVDGTTVRAAAIDTVIDAGFTVKSPQLELTFAPMYDVTTGTTGLRYVFAMALPIGNHPFYMRTSGDIFPSDAQPGDRGNRIGSLFLMSLGYGSSMHLGL